MCVTMFVLRICEHLSMQSRAIFVSDACCISCCGENVHRFCDTIEIWDRIGVISLSVLMASMFTRSA